ncbi:FAD-binding domain-containing protein [Brevundimonas sp.]|uniref:FAD-binding domain-containing protein n=1 Tax=Brevundimonas sp. TaxID=1871086 RepID=UPI00261D1D58|nr:FAD-binding domain-containing protein [Brevundimonas sp.]
MTEGETPTRAAGLARLEAFAPRMGRAYAANRNADLGPGANVHVSGLSPWIRRRLVTEAEAVRAALETHGPRGADKFVQEVLWRTYWKGWLEMRPSVWTEFEAARDRLDADDPAVRAAADGRTGISGFDDWARELAGTGWLHNHARMWFASIWIFTLGLPWELGADLFLRRLTDADPASNTLSWRWVAGLQTPGKTYLATAENIARFTEGRFRPKGLAREARPVAGPPPPAARPLPPAWRETPDGPHLLLITGEDLTPEQLIGPWEIAGVVSVAEPGGLGRGGPAAAFSDGALADAERRAEARYGQPVRRLQGLTADALVAAAQAAGAGGVVTAYSPAGPTAAALALARPGVEAAGLELIEVRRPWDAALWPLATRGFFPFRERAPEALRTLGLAV